MNFLLMVQLRSTSSFSKYPMCCRKQRAKQQILVWLLLTAMLRMDLLHCRSKIINCTDIFVYSQVPRVTFAVTDEPVRSDPILTAVPYCVERSHIRSAGTRSEVRSGSWHWQPSVVRQLQWHEGGELDFRSSSRTQSAHCYWSNKWTQTNTFQRGFTSSGPFKREHFPSVKKKETTGTHWSVRCHLTIK